MKVRVLSRFLHAHPDGTQEFMSVGTVHDMDDAVAVPLIGQGLVAAVAEPPAKSPRPRKGRP